MRKTENRIQNSEFRSLAVIFAELIYHASYI
jgi:hypothetical protein